LRKAIVFFLIFQILNFALILIGCSTGGKHTPVLDANNTKGVIMDNKTKKQIDPEIQAVVDQLPEIFTSTILDSQNCLEYRDISSELAKSAIADHYDFVTISEELLENDDRRIKLYVYNPNKSSELPRPAILWIHGGGFIAGSGRDDAYIIPYVRELNIPVISFDYRLLPEHPFPAALEDCYATWLWLIENSERLNIDPERICISGASAGGTLATGLSILNEKRNTAQPAFLLLRYPMLDNLHDTPSGSKEGYYIWDRYSSFNIWEMYLGNNTGLEVSPLAAPTRAEDLSFFPPTYIQICDIDLFRDENILFAMRLKEAGISANYDVFPGVIHAGEVLAPQSEIGKEIVSKIMTEVRKGLRIQ
jgi:acetyl esterase/lipase